MSAQLLTMETAAVLATILAVVHTQPTNDVTGFSLLSGVNEKCSHHPDVYSCLKMRAVTLLDRALAADSLPVSEFVTITKDPKAKDDVPLRPTNGDLEATLPRDLVQKSSALDKMVLDRLSQFLKTRTLQLNMPTDVFEVKR
ncbi:hypothetical protein J6590_087816 [Homalodisca vitripennis]|nr:hypothetical protein J6590_087816 [Homalodisca vitripennis]